MNYNIKGTSLDITDELRSYAEKKLEPAEKFVHEDTTALVDVVLEYTDAAEGKAGKFRAEFNLSSKGCLHHAEAWGSSMHEAIDLGCGELTEELHRNKEKHIDEARRGAHEAKEILHEYREGEEV